MFNFLSNKFRVVRDSDGKVVCQSNDPNKIIQFLRSKTDVDFSEHSFTYMFTDKRFPTITYSVVGKNKKARKEFEEYVIKTLEGR